MESSSEDLELQFLRAYKNYIYIFNLIESNIVLCLSHAKREGDFSSTVDKFNKYSFNEKVRRLKNLTKSSGLYKYFCEWFELMERCRSMRNKIVHGHWEFKWWLDASIHFDIPAPVNEQGKYTLEEFTNELEVLNKVMENFSQLRKNYEIKESILEKTEQET